MEADLKNAKNRAQKLLENPENSVDEIEKGLPKIKKDFDLNKIVLVDNGDGVYHIHLEINPKDDTKKEDKEEESKWSYLSISQRHFPKKVSIPKKTGNTMFTISEELVNTDLKEIHLKGDSIRVGDKFNTSSGRIYKIHNDSVHPLTGSPGTISIESQEYKILIVAKKHGVEKALNQMNILLEKGLLNQTQVDRTKKLINLM